MAEERKISKDLGEILKVLRNAVEGRSGEEEQRLNLDDFKKHVEIVKALIQNKRVYFYFYLAGFKFDTDQEFLSKLLAERQLSTKEFQSFLHRELTQFLFVVLEHEEEEFVEQKFHTDGERELAKSKLELVKKEIVDRAIRDRFLLSRISVGNLLYDIEWEINDKVADKAHPNVQDLRSATFRLEIGDARDIETKDRKAFSFECTIGEIDMLISELEKLRKILHKP